MSESYFYVGNTDILSNFYVGNTDTPTFLAKKSLKIAPFLMSEKVLRVSFARYAFCGHKPFSCILLGKSPKTPNIYIGVSLFGTPFLKTVFSTLEGASLFDTLFGKVRHFLTHLLEKCSTF